MQKVSYSTALIFLMTLALVLPVRVQALSIQLNDDGTVVVQPGNVLGDSTEEQGETQPRMESGSSTTSNTSGGSGGNEVKAPSEGSGGGSGGSSGNFGGGTTGGVAPAEIRSTGTRPVQLGAETLKKQEEKKREMTQKIRKDTEQAARVKRMIENKKSSVEVEMRNEGTTGVSLKMREFEKRKNENAKEFEEKREAVLKEATEKNRDEIKKSFEKRNDQQQDDEQENETRKIKSIVEERAEQLNLRNGSTDIRSTEKGFEIEKGNVKVKTNLPISIQTDTKQLSIVTPTGTKTITTLPDEAKNTVESSGFARQVVGDITLEQDGEDVVFRMNTVNTKRMFGLLPVQVNREVEVSATTGQITGTTQSFGQRLLDLFSF